jgi:hypothetical protein
VSSGSPKSPVRVGALLGTGRLGELTREAERRRGFTGRIRAKLPPDEGEHLVSAAENDAGELVLVMDSPAWAARVRYRAAELGVRRLRVKVGPPGASKPE